MEYEHETLLTWKYNSWLGGLGRCSISITNLRRLVQGRVRERQSTHQLFARRSGGWLAVSRAQNDQLQSVPRQWSSHLDSAVFIELASGLAARLFNRSCPVRHLDLCVFQAAFWHFLEQYLTMLRYRFVQYMTRMHGAEDLTGIRYTLSNSAVRPLSYSSCMFVCSSCRRQRGWMNLRKP